MISEEVKKVLNEQVNKELYSAYLYLSMSAYFSDLGLNGFANWMRIQFQEEQAHALLIYDYIVNRNERVILEQIEKPQIEWKSPLDVFENALKHEIYVSSLINNVINVAEKSKDRATMSYFQWFVDEQVEEEAAAQEIISNLKLIGEDKSALFMIDKDLSTRVFTPPIKSATGG